MSAVPARKRKWLSPASMLVAAGLVGAILMSLAMSNTLSAFVATITNSNNTAASGTVILQETSGATICNSTDGTGNNVSNNAFTCTSINKYGGSTVMVPGSTVTTTLGFKNTGTATAASFALAPGACTQGVNGANNGTAIDFCSKLNVVISSGGTTIKAATAAALASGGAIIIPPANIPAPGGASVPFTVAVTLDATVGNTYQGLSASQPLVWTLSS